MDYIKELQGLAGRIRSIEPGTYLSRLYQINSAANDEQRQIISLLHELQLALESPLLLSAPPEGTVLYLGMAKREVDAALSHLFAALEKCLFFGAEGSMPDFWWVLNSANEETTAPASPAYDGNFVDALAFRGQGGDTDSGYYPKGSRTPGTKSPERLAATVQRQARVYTGHARCRAWARGLLGLDGASAEEELRRAAASVARATTDESLNRSVIADERSEEEQGPGPASAWAKGERVGTHGNESDPDASGAGSRGGGPNSIGRIRTLSAPVILPTGEHDHDRYTIRPSPPPPPALLPLWLRPTLKGSSVLDDICRSVVEFRIRLKERGVSIRPSLDHAWLNQESLAADMTFSWPSFPRTRLRCYVRGAGLSAVNGEYSPAEVGESEDGASGSRGRGLTLLGPNGCKISSKVRAAAAVEQRTAVPVVVAKSPAAGPKSAADSCTSECGIAHEDDCTTTHANDSNTSVESQDATIGPTPAASFAQLWCLSVSKPARSGPDTTRSVYFGLGNGPLPPSRGWRSTDAADSPAPVLGFATQGGFLDIMDGESRRGSGGDREEVAGEERPDITPLFRAALPPVGGCNDAGDLRHGLSAEVEAIPRGDKAVASSEASTAGRFTRRRKRRRPAEVQLDTISGYLDPSELAVTEDPQAKNVLENENTSADIGALSGVGSGGEMGNGGHLAGHYSNASAQGDRIVDCEGDDEAVAAFQAERWRLPDPSGEVLSRAEKARELLQRTIEEHALVLAIRRQRLEDQTVAAEREFQKVLQESTETTVGRMLAARQHLREEAEAELAAETVATAVSRGSGSGGGGTVVPSLEELVADKAEELRTGLQSQGAHDKRATRPSPVAAPSTSRDDDSERRNAAQISDHELSQTTVADAGWPWPTEWLAAPRVPPPPPRDIDTLGFAIEGGFGDPDAGDSFHGERNEGGVAAAPDSGGGSQRIESPVPHSIEAAAVEVVDAEDSDAAHIEYVLRIVYHERTLEAQGQQQNPAAVTTATASAVPGAPAREPKESGGGPCTTKIRDGGDRAATELAVLVTAAKGLLQRTRVLSKRLNSLCAIHPQLMWEMEEACRLRPEAQATGIKESLEFPDPFELGVLEESILRVHRDKLTPRFKANSPTRKLLARVGAYLSGLLHFLGVLKAAGEADVRTRMTHVLNDALSTCDRAGRKRRRDDFTLGVRLQDIAGGRLGSGGGDEERLRVQERSCLGCGRAIAAEFLGIKKDYSPCRFADGLFCRSHCHNEDRRIIPHRVVHHWDFATHRVCKDSRAFLDTTRFLPVFDLPELSPALFADYQPLRTARWRRKQLHLLRRAVSNPPGSECISGARLLEKLLDGRMHLAINPDLYSLEDLIGVRNGNLLDFLEETNEVLVAHVMDVCETCEARAARVCDSCETGDPVFAFQIGTVAHCPTCDGIFHTKCIAEMQATQQQQQQQQREQEKPPTGSGSSKRRHDHQSETIGNVFVCPKCNMVAPMADVVGE